MRPNAVTGPLDRGMLRRRGVFTTRTRTLDTSHTHCTRARLRLRRTRRPFCRRALHVQRSECRTTKQNTNYNDSSRQSSLTNGTVTDCDAKCEPATTDGEQTAKSARRAKSTTRRSSRQSGAGTGSCEEAAAEATRGARREESH